MIICDIDSADTCYFEHVSTRHSTGQRRSGTFCNVSLLTSATINTLIDRSMPVWSINWALAFLFFTRGDDGRVIRGVNIRALEFNGRPCFRPYFAIRAALVRGAYDQFIAVFLVRRVATFFSSVYTVHKYSPVAGSDSGFACDTARRPSRPFAVIAVDRFEDAR